MPFLSVVVWVYGGFMDMLFMDMLFMGVMQVYVLTNYCLNEIYPCSHIHP